MSSFRETDENVPTIRVCDKYYGRANVISYFVADDVMFSGRISARTDGERRVCVVRPTGRSRRFARE